MQSNTVFFLELFSLSPNSKLLNHVLPNSPNFQFPKFAISPPITRNFQNFQIFKFSKVQESGMLELHSSRGADGHAPFYRPQWRGRTRGHRDAESLRKPPQNSKRRKSVTKWSPKKKHIRTGGMMCERFWCAYERVPAGRWRSCIGQMRPVGDEGGR